ncbi:MAG: hypothetical protein DRJ96_03940 [Thermoprotei archaeon]|nr:MAG: hypothetical protein DRJ96_03940 [Thermoprotei archaeon]
MCRMLGLISVRPVDAAKYLVEDECSLLAQAIKGDQGDGWGVGYYACGEPRVVKSPRPVWEEAERFKRVASQAASHIIIAHVRKASNPRGLPRERLIGLENTQPFHHGRYLFAHNGTIYVPDEAAAMLGEYRRIIKGVNDSEVYFAHLVKALEECGDVVEALREVEAALWRALRASGSGRDTPYSSLNAIFSDGVRLYALTLYRKGRDMKSLCYRDAEYFRMAYRHEGDTLVVASERTCSGGWSLLNNGELLIAEPAGGEVAYRVVKVFDIA